MDFQLHHRRRLEAFLPAAKAIVKSSFRQPPQDASLLQLGSWEASLLCLFVDADDLSPFLDRLFLQVAKNGGDSARLAYIRGPERQPGRLLKTPASFLIDQIQSNLELVDFQARVLANDPDALMEMQHLASMMCGCYVAHSPNRSGIS